MVNDQVHCRIEGNVDDQYECQIEPPGKDGVHDDEEQVGCQYGDEHCRGLHPCADEFVVEMILVREERASSLPYPVEGDPHHIKHRYEQRAECDDHISCPPRFEIGLLAQVNHQIAQDVAEGEAAGIPHEEFVPLALVTEYVVEPEYDHNAESDKGESGVDVFPVQDEHPREYAQCDAAQP